MIFRLGAEWLALPASVFQEVAEPRPVHSLPHRRGRLLQGLVNVRGELLICVSLGKLLGIETAAAAPAVRDGQARIEGAIYERLVVVATEGGRLVFPVSEAHGIERFVPERLQPVPATLGLASARYARGILPWRGHSVGCLDDGLLFHTLNRSLG
jgi:chemotaxis-related protein WspD